MRLTQTLVTKLHLTDLDQLDPITVILEDLGPGQGSIIIECFGASWAAYWGSMGDRQIAEFVVSTDDDYLIGKLAGGLDEEITDYNAISERIGEDVDARDDLSHYEQAMADAYGADWYLNLPTCTNPQYTYLKRVLAAVREGLQLHLRAAA